jgi:hypothetical protein
VHGPVDVGGQAEERPVDGDRPLQQVGQRRVLLAQVGQAGAEVVDQRPQQVGVEQRVGVRQRAAADRLDVQEAVDARQPAGVLDAAERPQRGVEERQQVGDDDRVVAEDAVGVVVGVAEAVEEPLQGADVVAPGDLLGQDLGTRLASAAASAGGWSVGSNAAIKAEP